MVIDKSKVKRILVITLSNVGDIILTTPVVKTLAANFPDSRMDVLVGPNGAEVFEKDPSISKVIVYYKHASLMEKQRLAAKLRRLKYDLIVDLRNTIFGILLGPRYRTSAIQIFPKEIVHKKEEHLYRLNSLGIGPLSKESYLHVCADDEDNVSRLMEAEGLVGDFVVVSPGAKSHLKRWPGESFARLCDSLASELGVRVAFVGLGEDADVVGKIAEKMKTKPVNLVTRTSLRELAALLKRAKLIITNDSAPLHLACAVGCRVLALFGPTDPAKYGPTGKFDVVIKKELVCVPCESAVCRFNYECLRSITPEEVFAAARAMLK
jgi:ADP-heptose:LPS heptosyltransferase